MFLSHILLLIWYELGWALQLPHFYIFQEFSILVIPQYKYNLGLYCPPFTFSVTLFEENLPKQHPDTKKWDPKGTDNEHYKEYGDIQEYDAWL